MRSTTNDATRGNDIPGRGDRGPLDRILNIFADVRAGEGLTAILLMFNIFLLLAGYYLLKTIREPLILASPGGGAEVKSYAAPRSRGFSSSSFLFTVRWPRGCRGSS